LAKVDKFT